MVRSFLVCCFIAISWASVVQVASDGDSCGYTGITQGICEARGCVFSQGARPPCTYPTGLPERPVSPYSDDERAKVYSYLMANIDIDGTGLVVASPQRSNPNYYYHWMRDGSRSMYTVFEHDAVRNSLNLTIARDWLAWIEKASAYPDPDGHGQSPLDEPKFDIPSGRVYEGGWCRPQNDGPALRMTALLRLLRAVNEPLSMTTQYIVRQHMNFVVDHWNTTTCDLWEEIHSTSLFWNLVVHRRALLQSAKAIEKVGGAADAAKWRATAALIGAEMLTHVPVMYGGHNSQHPYITEASNRPLDSAVACALNLNDETLREFPPSANSSDTVLLVLSTAVDATIAALSEAFMDAFPINKADSQRGLGGVLLGRYPGDRYFGGNPWILLSQCLAELHYRRSAAAREIGLKNRSAAEFAAGDAVMMRVRYHVAGADFHMGEQLNKDSGYEMSARDLTWSYDTFVSAMRERDFAAP